MGSQKFEVFNCLTDPILVIDAEYTIVFANQAMAVLCGKEVGKIIGGKCHLISHGCPQPCTETELGRRPCSHAHVFSQGSSLRQQHRHQFPNGNVKIFDMTSSPLRNAKGRITHVVQVLRDITREEKLRNMAEAKQFELENLFSHAPFFISSLDSQMRVRWINTAMEQMTGFQSQAIQGRHCYDLWGQYAGDKRRRGKKRICNGCAVQQTLCDGNIHKTERRVRNKIYEVITLPLTTSNGSIFGTIEFGFEITARKKTEEELRNSESRFRILFENSPSPLCVADFSGIKGFFDSLRENSHRDLVSCLAENPSIINNCLEYIKILDVNQAALELIGLPSKEALFTNIDSLLKKIPLHENPEGLFAIARGEKKARHELILYSAANEKLHTILHWAVEPGHEQTYGRVLLSINDISDRKRAEHEILVNAERMRLLHKIDQAVLEAGSVEEIGQVTLTLLQEYVRCASGCVILFDFERKIASLLACARAAPSGFCADREIALHCSEYLESLRAGQPFLLEDIAAENELCPIGEMLLADGFRFFLSVPLLTKDGLIGSLNLLDFSPRNLLPEQITFIRQAAPFLAVAIHGTNLLSSLNRQKEELRALSQRLADAEETERRRLASELHDEAGQNLSALAINLDILKKQLPRQNAAAQKRLDDSIVLIDRLTAQIRTVMAELRPPVIDDYGLLASIQWLADRFMARTEIPVLVHGREARPRLSSAKEIALFRVTQEALNNIAKHAQAATVDIELSQVDKSVHLTIRDNGKGFDRNDPKTSDTLQHWGLLSMRERVEAFSGQFSLDSAPGAGTTITVEMPV
jgi:PAS domain S-box-containing protein